MAKLHYLRGTDPLLVFGMTHEQWAASELAPLFSDALAMVIEEEANKE